MNFLLFFILNIIFNNEIQSYLIFPLDYLHDKYYAFNKKRDKVTPKELLQQIYYKNLITKLTIGTPSINYSVLLDINGENYYITSMNISTKNSKQNNISSIYNFNIKEYFNENISLSYKKIMTYYIHHGYDNLEEMCLSTEKIIFNNNTNNNNNDQLICDNFPIRLKHINSNSNNHIPGIIGLLFNNTYNEYEYGEKFISELKQANIIDNHYWFFDIEEISPLKNTIKGQLVIGAIPHEAFPQKYSINDYSYTNSHKAFLGKNAWRLYIDKVYVYNNTQNFEFGNTNMILSYEIYNIIGNIEFHDKIKEVFMDKLIEEKKCFISNFSDNNYFNSNISFYYCYKSVENILYKYIPNIKFNSVNLGFIFDLTKEELFYIEGNYIFFMILFSSRQDNYWIMGQMLTTKYNFVFNLDNKLIGLYKKVSITKNNDEKYDYKKDNNMYKIFNVFIIIIVGLIFCCGLFLGKRVFRIKKKILVNELIEERNYDYKVYNDEGKSIYNSLDNDNKGDIMIEMKKKINN